VVNKHLISSTASDVYIEQSTLRVKAIGDLDARMIGRVELQDGLLRHDQVA